MTVNPIAFERSFEGPSLDDRSRCLRRLTIHALKGGERGHIGSTMSLIEIMRVLYDDILSFKPELPDWSDRDCCILSKGHGCLALYALLADKGFFPVEELKTFCKQGSILGGHPEAHKIPGVEASTGALGHGLPIGVGRALASRMHRRLNRVFVIMGDGEINEGSVWEAAMCASKHKLSNLVAIIDYNKIQSAGPTADILELEPLLDKWRAFGFAAIEVNGHDVSQLRGAFANTPVEKEKPTAIICHTVKGKGLDFAEHDPSWHHQSRIDQDLIDQLYDALEREPA